ncbi:hypothetical protein K1719_029870 [Acacia pycnantha]|nr:hypothetical protein K1719_029870 [Acacia pycnantha]
MYRSYPAITGKEQIILLCTRKKYPKIWTPGTAAFLLESVLWQTDERDDPHASNDRAESSIYASSGIYVYPNKNMRTSL